MNDSVPGICVHRVLIFPFVSLSSILEVIVQDQKIIILRLRLHLTKLLSKKNTPVRSLINKLLQRLFQCCGICFSGGKILPRNWQCVCVSLCVGVHGTCACVRMCVQCP